MTGEFSPDSSNHDDQVNSSKEESLDALIEQIEKNWELDNNAANDELVIRIREHIRQQQTRHHR